MGRFFVPSIMFSALLGQAASHAVRNCALLLPALICFVLGVCPLALGESVMVPMRDGIKLPTIIALPGSGSYPVVLTRGYTAGGLSSHAGRFNKAGYAFVSQQCRGGGGSHASHIVLPIILVIRSEALLRRVASDRGTK